MESINDYQEREPRRQTAFGRWGQTVLGHFPFHAGIALLQSLSFLPGAACIYLYGRLGGAIFLAAGWLLLGEKISLMCIIGAVLITLGVIFAGKSDS